jgi:hypothetical protein
LKKINENPMRIYLVIVLLNFITATKSKDGERVKKRGRSSKKQLSVSKNIGKEVEREKSSSKKTKKKLKTSKKSYPEDKKKKEKVGKTKEKKKIKKKKTKKREDELEKKRSGEVDGKETKNEDITSNPSVNSPAIKQNDQPATSESPAIRQNDHPVSSKSPAIKQNGYPVSSESSSSYTQTTFPPKTIPEPRVPKPPVTTAFPPSNISDVLTSIARNKSIVNRTTNSTIATTGTQPTDTTASSTVSPNND